MSVLSEPPSRTSLPPTSRTAIRPNHGIHIPEIIAFVKENLDSEHPSLMTACGDKSEVVDNSPQIILRQVVTLRRPRL